MIYFLKFVFVVGSVKAQMHWGQRRTSDALEFNTLFSMVKHVLKASRHTSKISDARTPTVFWFLRRQIRAQQPNAVIFCNRQPVTVSTLLPHVDFVLAGSRSCRPWSCMLCWVPVLLLAQLLLLQLLYGAHTLRTYVASIVWLIITCLLKTWGVVFWWKLVLMHKNKLIGSLSVPSLIIVLKCFPTLQDNYVANV